MNQAATQFPELCRRAHDRGPDTVCAWREVENDLADLAVLLRERHFGLATGVVAEDGIDRFLDQWADRLRRERPSTWGRVLGSTVIDLRWLLGDNHLDIAGSSPEIMARADPRGREPRTVREPGPMVEESERSGVLCLRIRQFGGSSRDSVDQSRRWQEAHQDHFRFERIVLDLRANPGGDDTYPIDWARDHLRRPVDYPSWQEWRICGQLLGTWNLSVYWEAIRGLAALGEHLDRSKIDLGSSVSMIIREEPFRLPSGSDPWPGRMMVITDRGSASAAEGTAWLLRSGLDARLVGGNSAGAMAFGNMTPYLLPRSGLKIDLPSATSGFQVEMTGLGVDLPLDVGTPLPVIADRFDELWDAAGHR